MTVEGGKPDAFHRVTNVPTPSLTIYLPPGGKAVGATVIVAPVGGHRFLMVDLEGEFVARKLIELGIAA